jgi:citronellol/citronellal dehydrogenase
METQQMNYQSVFRPDLFVGQTIIVTGGGSGIGRCTAHELAALGADVVLVGRAEGKLRKVKKEIEDCGGKATWFACDIRDEEAVISTVQAVMDANGRIDGLVNNAGGQYRAAMKTISTKGFEAVLRNNLVGGFIFMREVYTRWMESNGGAIVNMIADISNGWPNFSHSGASRGGMLTLSESAACEWGASGVRVNTVAPGAIASSGLDTYEPKDREYIRREVAGEIPLQRFGTESEVAAAIVFLLSPAAAFISGSCLRIDGAAPNARRVWWKPEPAKRGEIFNGFQFAALPDILMPSATADEAVNT